MMDRIGKAIATADGADFENDPARYRRLALAALGPLVRPTEAMVDAAHEVVWFDACWIKKAVRATIRAAMERLASLTLRREMNEPAFYFRAVLLQPCQEFCCCLVRVLVNWMNSVASLKVGYVVS
ncbi:MAG: hypothetical protein ACLPKW_34040 [Acetobacteraceae bacterium]